MFGQLRRLPEVTPAHMALHLAVDVKARTGHRFDNRPQWKRPRGRPRHPWMQQLEVYTGLAADAAWDTASDQVEWRAQRPIAGKWFNE